MSNVDDYFSHQTELESLRERVKELEAETQVFASLLHAKIGKLEAAEAKLAEIAGLPRFNVENGDPQMGGGYGPYRIKAIPKSRWINDGMFVRADELQAELGINGR